MTSTTTEWRYALTYLEPGPLPPANRGGRLPGGDIDAIEVRVGDLLTVDRQLAIDSIESTIEVTSTLTPLLERASASIGMVVDRRRIEELPLQLRRVLYLVEFAKWT